MSPQNTALCFMLSVLSLALCTPYSDEAKAQNKQTQATYAVVEPPKCTNDKGENVRFIDNSKGRAGMASGMAIRDQNGKPVVLRNNYSNTPPEFQSFIDRHECAHHQTGDVDRPHPPRNSSAHLMNESISDCVAILRIRDEEGYDRAGFLKVATALRNEMAKIGFPKISISSRISNIDNCYTEYGSPQDFINGVLKQRGLI